MFPHQVTRYESYAADRALVQLHADVSFVFGLFSRHVDRPCVNAIDSYLKQYTNKLFLNRVLISFTYWPPFYQNLFTLLFTLNQTICFFINENIPTTPIREQY